MSDTMRFGPIFKLAEEFQKKINIEAVNSVLLSEEWNRMNTDERIAVLLWIVAKYNEKLQTL